MLTSFTPYSISIFAISLEKIPFEFHFLQNEFMKYPLRHENYSTMQLHHHISFDVIVKMLFRHFAPGNQQNKTNMH